MVLSSATKISHFLFPLISSENDSFTTKSRLPNDEFTIQIQNHNRNHLSNIRNTEFLFFDFLSKCKYVTKIKTKNLKLRKQTQFLLQESILTKV